MRAAVLAAGLLVSACNGCKQPPPQPVSPGQYTYNRLVEAGCLQPDPVNGPAQVTQDLATPPVPDWELCVADGGVPATCGGPCAPGAE